MFSFLSILKFLAGENQRYFPANEGGAVPQKTKFKLQIVTFTELLIVIQVLSFLGNPGSSILYTFIHDTLLYIHS